MVVSPKHWFSEMQCHMEASKYVELRLLFIYIYSLLIVRNVVVVCSNLLILRNAMPNGGFITQVIAPKKKVM